MCCIRRLTTAMLIQQHNPIIIGFPPVLINFTRLVLSPIAPIAIVIKNLPHSVNGFVTLDGILNTVLITAVNKKNNTNHGNIFVSLTDVLAFFLERYKASTRVIGIIANVLVSFTIVA